MRQIFTLLLLATLFYSCGTNNDHKIVEKSKKLHNVVDGQFTNKKYNILFIITDQETYFREGELPKNIQLPARDKLKNSGLYFTNHQIASNVCSPSRSVMFSGQHIQTTGVYDNLNFPWVEDFSTKMPTMAHVLNSEGYYSTYQGKWHLSKLMDTYNEDTIPSIELLHHMEKYGFHDYTGIGDAIGMTEGGFLNDDETIAKAQRWLRLKGNKLNKDGQPWFMTLSIVNPHDIMFYDTDAEGENKQEQNLPMAINKAQLHGEFIKKMDAPLSPTRHEPLTAKGRPEAHQEFLESKEALTGHIPNEDARWKKYNNYYFNLIENTDKQIASILMELENQGMADNTIIVMTADHGELRGAHGLHGKGGNAYAEQNHVPLIIYHPDFKQNAGQKVNALSSHMDLLPTMISWAGEKSDYTEKAMKNLKGHDLTPAMVKGEKAGINEVRKSALYNFNMVSYLDGQYIQKSMNAILAGEELPKGLKPDFNKRGSIRSITDGHYRFSRYNAPLDFNTPTTIEEIFAHNDVELYDLINDPYEEHNLALNPKKNKEVILKMNTLLNETIKEEVLVEDNGDLLKLDSFWEVK